MKLYIPEIGDVIKLTSDWRFYLYDEHRNLDLIEYFDLEDQFQKIREYNQKLIDDAQEKWYNDEITEGEWYEIRNRYGWWSNNKPCLSVVLNEGMTLKIDRIYIRRGNSDFSSISFRVNPTPDIKKSKTYRFWAKLADVNEIEFEKNQNSG